MNREIAEQMKWICGCLGFVDKLGGLVYTKEYKDPKGKVVKCPFYNDGTEESRFTPDENKKSVIYFEERTPEKVVEDSVGTLRMTSEIACIGWLNNRALGKADIKAHEAVLPIVKEIVRANPIHSKPISGLTFEFKEQLKGDKTLFKNYTYSEFKDYINTPYTVFGIVFTCNWYVPESCIESMGIGAEIC